MYPIISIKNLYKNYGYKQVLKGIIFEVYPGQVIGYIGPNGAGKSTTVKILCGLITDYVGSVQIKGMDLLTDSIKIKSLIAYVPETAELYDVLSPFEFLSLVGDLYNLPSESTKYKIENIISAMGLTSSLHQRMDSFSKGMKQKVLIASSLLHNPEIIILDEPLSGLDANSVIMIKELISRLAKDGKTIFYCSHMMDIVEKVSDRIILIDNGKVIADSTFIELKEKSGNTSLEQIFSSLTVKSPLSDSTDQIMEAIRK
jgi:ABC-2 type transport system ATP-binding protein